MMINPGTPTPSCGTSRTTVSPPRPALHLRSPGLRILALVAAVMLPIPSMAASAQTPAAIPPEHVSWYGDPGAPDISGVWKLADNKAVKTGTPASSTEGWTPWPAPLKGAFATTLASRMAAATAGTRTDDPVLGCVRPGMPRFITGMNGPLLIMQNHARVMMYRDGESPRRIWLDGREFPSPRNLEDFPKGTSVGHYQGANLMIESRGFKDYPIDSTGVPHSDDLKILEKYHRVDKQTLQAQITLIDPTAYTAPMVTTVTYKLVNDPLWAPHEFICTPTTDYHPDIYVH